MPTFLYAGTSKAGSSWIYEILQEHPEVFIPAAKDIMFFSQEYERGIDWYGSFFDKSAGAGAVGEICHDYYLKKEFAQRIQTHLPDVKLVFCLREPVDWMISQHGFILAAKRVSGSYLEFLGENSYLPGVVWGDYLNYYQCLIQFYDLFPRKNIKVLFFEELKTDPIKFAGELFSFIGVDTGFIPSIINERVNAAHEPRIRMLGYLAYKGARFARTLGLQNLLGNIKRNQFVLDLLYRSKRQNADIDEETAAVISSRYSCNYDELEKLVGRKLPASWYMRRYVRTGMRENDRS